MKKPSPEYVVWMNMRARCNNPKSTFYRYYGGRGITVCARWSSFHAFRADMGPKPSPAHTLDRRDNNKNYEPANCRWATRQEQNLNKRSNHILQFRGTSQPIAVWAQQLQMRPGVILGRVSAGWSTEEALTTRPKPRQRILHFSGQSKSVTEWAKTLGIHRLTLYKRLSGGWSVHRTLSTPLHV